MNPNIATLTSLEQWAVLFAVMVMLTLFGAGAWKVWSEISKFLKEFSATQRTWEETQENRRQASQEKINTTWTNAIGALNESMDKRVEGVMDLVKAQTAALQQLHDAQVTHQEWTLARYSMEQPRKRAGGD